MILPVSRVARREASISPEKTRSPIGATSRGIVTQKEVDDEQQAVWDNLTTLHQQLKALPWREVPVADHTRDRGHHRMEIRRLQVTTVAGLDFPHAAQALRVTPGSARSTSYAGGP